MILKRSLLILLVTIISINLKAQCVINATVSYTPNSVCLKDTVKFNVTSNVVNVNYDWTGPNGYTATGANATVDNVTMANQGSYVVVSSKTGCASDTDTVVINVNQPVIPTIAPDTPICSGDTLVVRLINPGGGFEAVGWAPDGTSDTTDANSTNLVFPDAFQATHVGEYKVITTSSNGCVSDTIRFTIPATAIVNIPDTPVASALANPICKGDTLRLTVNSSTNVTGYHWTGPNAQQFNQKDVVVYGYNLTGKQQFIVHTDSNGCFSEPDTLIVDVLSTADPKVTISADPGFIVGTNVAVTFTANVQNEGFNTVYQWRKNGVNIPNQNSKTYTAVSTKDIQQGDLLTVWIQTTPTCANTDTALSSITSLNIKLDVAELNNQNVIQLYPNPVTDILQVEGIEDAAKLRITNITGQLVDLTGKVAVAGNNVSINTASLAPGMYILQYENKAARFLKAE